MISKSHVSITLLMRKCLKIPKNPKSPKVSTKEGTLLKRWVSDCLFSQRVTGKLIPSKRIDSNLPSRDLENSEETKLQCPDQPSNDYLISLSTLIMISAHLGENRQTTLRQLLREEQKTKYHKTINNLESIHMKSIIA